MILKIYTTPTCPWCKKTKDWLKQNQIKYAEKNVAEDAAARAKMIKLSGQSGVPVIDINGTIIVGFDQQAIQTALKPRAKARK